MTDGVWARRVASSMAKSESAVMTTVSFAPAPLEDVVVGCNEQAVIANVGGVVARNDESFNAPRGQVGVEQILHARCARGRSRSFTLAAAKANAAAMSSSSR